MLITLGAMISQLWKESGQTKISSAVTLKELLESWRNIFEVVFVECKYSLGAYIIAI
jgi:hypothetical protein